MSCMYCQVTGVANSRVTWYEPLYPDDRNVRLSSYDPNAEAVEFWISGVGPFNPDGLIYFIRS